MILLTLFSCWVSRNVLIAVFCIVLFLFFYKMVEDVLKSKSGREEVLQEYQVTENLTEATIRHTVSPYLILATSLFKAIDCWAPQKI